jgi:hypothetical protein
MQDNLLVDTKPFLQRDKLLGDSDATELTEYLRQNYEYPFKHQKGGKNESAIRTAARHLQFVVKGLIGVWGHKEALDREMKEKWERILTDCGLWADYEDLWKKTQGKAGAWNPADRQIALAGECRKYPSSTDRHAPGADMFRSSLCPQWLQLWLVRRYSALLAAPRFEALNTQGG